MTIKMKVHTGINSRE